MRALPRQRSIRRISYLEDDHDDPLNTEYALSITIHLVDMTHMPSLYDRPATRLDTSFCAIEPSISLLGLKIVTSIPTARRDAIRIFKVSVNSKKLNPPPP